MASVLKRAFKFLSTIEEIIVKSIYFRFPYDNLAPVAVNFPCSLQNNYETSLSSLVNKSILWAVPKKRKTIEKRRSRRFGHPDYHYKMLLPKSNILICSECGSYREAGLLCPNCYSKVRAVTNEMQEAIQTKLGISPVENEIIVLYSDDEQNSEFYKGKQIVEIKKERPKLFSDNLLQRSTKTAATTQEIMQKKEFS